MRGGAGVCAPRARHRQQALRQLFGMFAQFRDRRGFPVRGTQQRAEIEDSIGRAAAGAHEGTVRTGGESQAERIRNRHALRDQRAQQPVGGAPRVVVRSGAVDHPIDQQRLRGNPGSRLPQRADLAPGALEAEQPAGVDLEMPRAPLLTQRRRAALGQPMPVQVPVGTHVPQEAPALGCAEPLPQARRQRARQRHRFAPVPALRIKFL